MYPHVYIVDARLHLISGTHSITEEDLGLPVGTLPPSQLATLGNLWVVNKKLLDTGKALRAKSKRLLASVGVKVGCGTVVTAADLNGLVDELEQIRTEFYDWKSQIIANFDTELDNWVAEHPEYGPLIKRYAPDLKRVERQLSMDIDVYKFAVPSSDPNQDLLKKTLSRSGNNISKRLIHEIAEFVADAYQRFFVDSAKLVKQNMGPLRETLLPKIKSFQMLDSSLSPVSRHLESFIDDVVTAIDAQPKGQKALEGPALAQFEARFGQLRTVSDIEKLIAAAPKSSSFAMPKAANKPDPSSEDKDRPLERPANHRPAAPAEPVSASTGRPVCF